MYRINYGNGQVSESFKTARLARVELDRMRARGDDYAEFARIESRENGEWFTVRTAAV